MKRTKKHAFFYLALSLSVILHGAILFSSYAGVNVSTEVERIHISLHQGEVLPRVKMPSDTTKVKKSLSKSDNAAGTIAASPQAITDEDGEKTMLRYTDMIRQRIQEAIIYPHQARKDGIEGRPYIRFSINPYGEVTSLELVRSSGFAILDEEALAAIRRASPFPKIPQSLGKQSLTYVQGLTFMLK